MLRYSANVPFGFINADSPPPLRERHFMKDKYVENMAVTKAKYSLGTMPKPNLP